MIHRTRTRTTAVLAGVAALALIASACGDNGGADPAGADEGANMPPDTDAEVTISVGNMPTSEDPELRATFERRLADFNEAYPHITIEPEETEWAADTWNALLAGGTMPTVISAPFTEIQSMIQRQQIADITDQLGGWDVLDDLNPAVQEVASDADGRVYGVPVSAWTMGLLYNRALFEEAGLDPDNPPQTWEDVRSAAQSIEESTSAQGFMSMTLDNTGGWVLTTMSYAFGATLQDEEGTTATFTDDATVDVLEYYKQLRWVDDTFGSNFLVNYDDAVNLFASGQVGMFIQGADNYTNMVVRSGMASEDFGVAPMPQQPDGLGTLSGGSVKVFSPTATPEEIAAALTWVEFQDFSQYIDEDTALELAQAASADGVAVGEPGLPVVSSELYDQWLEWVSDEVNVPRENYDLYLSTVEEVPLVPEPAVKAQELYNILDSVVQATLTREDADIEQLLSDAESTFQASLDLG